MIVLSSWAIGLVIGGISLGVDGSVGLAMFLLAGAILGSGLGGVQVSDRVLMLRLSPPEKLGEFFGLYGLVGKGSQVIGQLLFGVTLLLFQPVLGDGRVPARRPEPARDDARRAVAAPARSATLGRAVASSRGPQAGTLPERLAPASAPIEPRVGGP